jgi:sulfur carrier protein ThiS
MQIKVRPIGIIRRYIEGQDIELEDGLTPEHLIDLLKIPQKLKMVAYVNGKRRGLREELNDGDEVKLATLLGGG